MAVFLIRCNMIRTKQISTFPRGRSRASRKEAANDGISLMSGCDRRDRRGPRENQMPRQEMTPIRTSQDDIDNLVKDRRIHTGM